MSRTFRDIFLLAAFCASGNAVASEKWFEVQGGSWSPSESEMAASEPSLNKYVMKQAATHHLQAKPWRMYTFQYQGQLNAQGQEIAINAFCTDLGHELLFQEWLVAKDGGTCFFRVKYLPATGSFYDFEFNGEA